MLEFEDDNVKAEMLDAGVNMKDAANLKAGATMEMQALSVSVPSGFALVPLDTYNELLLDASNAQPIPLKVRRSAWGNKTEFELVLDKEWLHGVGMEMLKQKYGAEALEGYTVLTSDDIYVPTITLASRETSEGPDPF